MRPAALAAGLLLISCSAEPSDVAPPDVGSVAGPSIDVSVDGGPSQRRALADVATMPAAELLWPVDALFDTTFADPDRLLVVRDSSGLGHDFPAPGARRDGARLVLHVDGDSLVIQPLNPADPEGSLAASDEDVQRVRYVAALELGRRELRTRPRRADRRGGGSGTGPGADETPVESKIVFVRAGVEVASVGVSDLSDLMSAPLLDQDGDERDFRYWRLLDVVAAVGGEGARPVALLSGKEERRELTGDLGADPETSAVLRLNRRGQWMFHEVNSSGVQIRNDSRFRDVRTVELAP